ncbi:hypothetical protein ACFY9F_00280 [Streptomyces sp. NPDC012421]|uniref:hypothetical protein n=1 Tax=Streptomyces sp. NPDC012421 TaxID=3364832 RepID=UPI0036ED5B8D
MRLPRISAGKVLKGAAAGVAVCLLATACGEDEEKPKPERVRAEQQCDGTLSPKAALALQTVLNTKRFDDAPTGGLERAAGGLVEDYPESSRRTPTHSLCRASPASSMDAVKIRFSLHREGDLPGDEHAADMHRYAMGVDALSGPRMADLYVRCVSSRIEGSDKRPARIVGSLIFLRSKLPDTVRIREANLTILHSVTLAVVRKLGCEDDAGLTEKPVFKALPG